MNLTSLQYVLALHEHQHFGRAAAACHISQPALSNALRALEEELGVAIVRRGRVFQGFTPEGERVLGAAQRMLHERRLLLQDLSGQEDAPQGELRIGAVPSAMALAARFAAMLQKHQPGIAPVVRSMSSPDIQTGLDTLTLDLALGYPDRHQPQADRLQLWPQYQERYFLLCRAAEGISPVPTTWAAAAQWPLCLLTPEMHHRQLIDQAFQSAGTRVQPVMQTDSILALALAVRDGAVCSILPTAMVGLIRSWPGLVVQPLQEPVMQTPIAFMALASERPPRVLRAALAYLQQPEWQAQARAQDALALL